MPRYPRLLSRLVFLLIKGGFRIPARIDAKSQKMQRRSLSSAACRSAGAVHPHHPTDKPFNPTKHKLPQHPQEQKLSFSLGMSYFCTRKFEREQHSFNNT